MSKDKDNSRRNKIIATTLIAVVIGGGGFMLGWLAANDWYFSTNAKEISPDLDGFIDQREWLRSTYYNMPFYLDVNNSIDPVAGVANVDGWNYLSVGEDEENYYIALDLCSDRTNNIDGEWVSVALANRMPQATNSKLAMYAMENYGLEFLMYNVSDDAVMNDSLVSAFGLGNYNDIPYVPEYNSYDVIKGTHEGDTTDFWNAYDDQTLVLKSEYFDEDTWNNESDIIAVDFAVNVTEIFPEINDPSSFIPFITDFDCRMILSGNISASTSLNLDYAEYFSLRMAEHGAMPVSYDDPTYLDEVNNMVFSNNSFGTAVADMDQSNINLTDGMFYFSLFGWNNLNLTDPTAFEIYIDQIEFRITTATDFATTIGSSLEEGNYDVNFAFGPSDNCDIDHRMFEIRISKTEFPVVEEDMLYLNVGGYGTMAFENSDFWAFPQTEGNVYDGSPLYEFYDDDSDFLRLDMSTT